MSSTVLINLLLGIAAISLEPGQLTVLPGGIDDAECGRQVITRLNAEAATALQERKAISESLKTAGDIQWRQEALREQFMSSIGGFPERTPLNAQVVFQGTGDGFRYEKILLESRPGFYVSALLFLPEGAGPFPAVLIPCGHDANGKAAEAYQRGAILLARHGIAALCYDPIGQGERYAFYKEDGTPSFATTIEHTLIGVGAILTGTNIAAYRIFDGIRCLDYLESRADIDGARLGCTGHSGGGTLTSYIMALDPRVQAAAPSCYITSWEKLLSTIGPQDGEQNIFGQFKWGMNHADLIIMRAPKPTLICAATRDFFDIEGTWDTFREAKRAYTRFDLPEAVELVEVDEEHGYTPRIRATMVHWMQRWLLGKDEHVDEADCAVLTDLEAQCTESGRVKDLPGARSAFDLNRERMEAFAQQRRQLWTDPKAGLAKVAEQIAINLTDLTAEPEFTLLSTEELNGIRLSRLVFQSRSGISIPAIFLEPAQVLDGLVFVHEQGKAALLGNGERLDQWLSNGTAVLALDYTLAGELEPAQKYGGDWEKAGKHWDSFYRAYDLGKSLVGMRTQDILTAINFLAGRHAGATVSIHAGGAATVPALHAAAFKADSIDRVTLIGGIPSWAAVVNADNASGQIENAVHGALEWYDLPDLVTHVCPDMVQIEDAVVPVF